MRFVLILSLTILLAGCTSTPELSAPAVSDISETEPVIEPVTPPPERPIPEASVYPLLVAEFALHRQHFELALDEYMTQADRLQDRGVAERATRVAAYMNRLPETLDSAALWAGLDPQNVEVNNILATLLASEGRPGEALKYMEQMLRSGKEVDFSILFKGFGELSPQDRKTLINGLDDLAQRYPDNHSLALTRALVLEQSHEPEQALALLDSILDQDPNQVSALVMEAKLLQEQNTEDPFYRLRNVLKTQPDNQHLRLQYARLLTRTSLEEARAQFSILAATKPDDSNLLFSLAMINHELGDNATARTHLNQLLELGQRTDEAYYYLGRIDEADGLLDDAVRAYMAVNSPRSPNFFSSRGRMARILIDNGESERAHTLLEQARTQHPRLREQLYALEADVLRQSGHPDRGLTLLDQALLQNPDSTALRYSRAMLGEQMGNIELMESDLRYILVREPDNATTLNALGYSLSNHSERYSEAYELIKRAHELQPQEAAILDSMGWILYRLKRSEEALPYLEQAYRLFPDPEVAAHLGEVLWALGRANQARGVWTSALKLDPQHKILLATIRRFDLGLLQESP
ncbi:MAG: tetratricopeptide repeat protein [Parahaliea sp.]